MEPLDNILLSREERIKNGNPIERDPEIAELFRPFDWKLVENAIFESIMANENIGKFVKDDHEIKVRLVTGIVIEVILLIFWVFFIYFHFFR